MNSINLWLLLALILLPSALVLLLSIGYYRQHIREITTEFEVEIDDIEESHQLTLDRKAIESANAIMAALKKSKDVIRGNVSEEMAPLLKGFPYQMSDCKFSGKPLDYLVFNGMSNLRDNKNGTIEIIFADVKTGNSALSTVQRKIRDAIKEGRVKFETWIINNGEVNIK